MYKPGFNIFTGNRLEYLADAMSKVISVPLPDIFQNEMVIVQSRGMARWLSLNLAGRQGISANMAFLFPNEFINEILGDVLPGNGDASLYEPPVLAWRILSLFRNLPDDGSFSQLTDYMDGPEPELRQYQLALTVADTFDQYLLYRPAMIRSWEKGQGDGWQARLWRMIRESSGDTHRACLWEKFLEKTDKDDVAGFDFPDRIAVFGISSLPPFHMNIFQRLSRFIQVNLFLLNPCREYWGDIISSKEASKIRSGSGMAEAADLHVDTENALLSSMGQMGREFFDLINGYDHEAFRLFSTGDGKSLLSIIQNDICNLNSREENPPELPGDSDSSLEIHSCHSPMREAEVLFDSILGFIEEDGSLLPSEILVLTPDIETYSPFIKAVFDRNPCDGPRIPYSIADRTVRSESRIAETFLTLLDLPESRLTVSEIINILENESVYRKFGLSEPDFEQLFFRIGEAGIRWGRDSEHRDSLGMGGFDQNTWQAGIDRLLMGYAMPEGEDFFMDILPLDGLEGEDARVFGSFLDFVESVFSFSLIFRNSYSLPQWRANLLDLVDTFFYDAESCQQEISALKEEIANLQIFGETSGFEDAVGIGAIRYHIKRRLGAKKSGGGFLGNGITFCEMLPMRSIPFKIICLIGMNSDSYPRQSRSPGFDLISAKPMPGDRSRRKDDKYLFLEVLISAREKLYISYTGQSIRDNTPIEPSVPVSELIDYINEKFDEESRVLQVKKHPLQAFSPEYFKEGNGFFSYSAENFEAAGMLQRENGETPPFFKDPIPSDSRPGSEIDADDFCRFFANPSRYILEKRLGIIIKNSGVQEIDEEPFYGDGLLDYILGSEFTEKIITDSFLEDDYYRIRATGVLPVGETGKCRYDMLAGEAASFAEKIRNRLPDTEPGTVYIDIEINGLRITGNIKGVYDNLFAVWRYAAVRGKDVTGFWVRYLLLQAMAGRGEKSFSGFLAGIEKKSGEKKYKEYLTEPVENPEDLLSDLADLYIKGRNVPLVFFPETSFRYVQKIISGNADENKAMDAALKEWNGNYNFKGEGNDRWFSLCFRNRDPFNDLFREIAMTMFGPFFQSGMRDS